MNIYINKNKNKQSVLTPHKDKDNYPKIIDIFGTFYIENIVTALAKKLRDSCLDVYVNIRNIDNTDIIKCKSEEGRFLFICCPQTLLQSKTGPIYPSSLMPLPENKYFLYQFEQLDTCNDNSKYLNDHFINLVKCARYTFDYSQVNLAYYPKEVNDRVCYMAPPIVETHYKVLSDKKYDIFFCGYKNERRENILFELTNAGYNVLHVTNVFGEELTKLISESRIFINIHCNESRSLETCRLHEAVMSKDTYIISEKSGVPEVDKIYEGRVIFTEKEDILKTVKTLLNINDKDNDKDYKNINICKFNNVKLNENFINNLINFYREPMSNNFWSNN